MTRRAAPAPDLGRRRHGRARPDHRRLRHGRGVGGADRRRAAADRPPRAATRRRPRRPPTPEPTPVPTPEAELHICNYAEYIGEDVDPVVREEVQRQGQLRLLRHVRGDVRQGRRPARRATTSPSRPRPTSRASSTIDKILPLDLSLIPNKVNLGQEWANPGYDPGNAHSMPYMWWTTGVAYDSDQDQGDADELEGALGRALERATSRCSTTSARPSRRRSSSSTSAPTRSTTAELDAGARRCSSSSTRSSGCTASRTSSTWRRGDIWIGHAWGSDIYTVQQKKPSVQFYIPEEGSVRGSDTAVILEGAKNPIAANLFINHLLDAKVSADNSNYIGYMGPNEAAKQYISKDLLDTPVDQPGQGRHRQAPGAARPRPRPRQVRDALDRAEGRHLATGPSGRSATPGSRAAASCRARSGWRCSSSSRWRSSPRSASGRTTGSAGSCSTP